MKSEDKYSTGEYIVLLNDDGVYKSSMGFIYNGTYGIVPKRNEVYIIVNIIPNVGLNDDRSIYEIVTPSGGNYFTHNQYESFRKATKDEIRSSNFNKENKIFGYVLVKEYPGSPSIGTKLKLGGMNNAVRVVSYPEFWQPIYDIEIKKFILRCVGGSFEVEVSKKGIYYRKENMYFSVKDIRTSINWKVNVRDHLSFQFMTFKPSHIDSGSMLQVPIQDWKEVLDYYDSIK